jgi:polyisoprenoid-binding protein YceI
MSTNDITSIDGPLARDISRNNGLSSTRTTYQIDPAASRIQFTIRKRLMYVKHLLVTGRFTDVQGTMDIDEREPANSRAEVTIGTASVDTKSPMGKRDKHLREAEFFDVERYPRMIFKSRRIETIDRASGHYRVVGDLTVRDVEREVILDALYTPARHEAHEPRISLSLTTTLNRRDFGMSWNRSYIDIADELTVTLEVEASPA